MRTAAARGGPRKPNDPQKRATAVLRGRLRGALEWQIAHNAERKKANGRKSRARHITKGRDRGSLRPVGASLMIRVVVGLRNRIGEMRFANVSSGIAVSAW